MSKIEGLKELLGGDLDFPIFTEEVELPSKGRFYPKDSPLAKLITISLKHPRTYEQDILTNRSLLKKGTALDEFIKSLIVDPVIVHNYDNLIACDRSALAAQARVLMHGKIYHAKGKCRFCDHRQDISVDLTEIEPHWADHSEEEMAELGVSAEETAAGTVFHKSIVLPNEKEIDIGFKLLNGRDEKEISEFSTKQKKLKLRDSPTASTLKKIIVSVEGKTNRDFIWAFVDNVPARSILAVYDAYKKVSPDFKIVHDFECEECGSSEEGHEVALDASFFWPKR